MIRAFLRLEAITTGLALRAAIALLCVTAGLAMFQVVTRFVFDAPSTWSEVVTRSAMIWSVFLGIAAAYRHGAMISVDLVQTSLPAPMGRALFVAANAGSFLFFAILLWQGWLMCGRVARQNLAALEISIAWVYAALPVGAAFILVAIVAATIRGLTGTPAPPQTFGDTV